MFAKIVLDGQIIDAVKELVCCRYNNRARRVLRCGVDDKPSGIISERTGNVYQVDGWPIFPAAASTAGTVEISYITEDEYKALVEALDINGPVTEPEETDIPADASFEFVQEAVIKKMSAACNAVITNGVDVVFPDGTISHFSLKLEDQNNLISLQLMLASGYEAVPYHADGEECRYYTAEEFTLISTTATTWKMYHESYFNSLRSYIRAMQTTDEMLAVVYGMPIPEEYQSQPLQQMMAQMAAQAGGA